MLRVERLVGVARNHACTFSPDSCSPEASAQALQQILTQMTLGLRAREPSQIAESPYRQTRYERRPAGEAPAEKPVRRQADFNLGTTGAGSTVAVSQGLK